ncbi:MAG: cobyrinate a,c-diamide synthase [Alphaproteobacteria bacterium]
MAAALISAMHKSSGKTLVSLGIAAALAKRGLAVQPFKKGPDDIDPLWLSRAAGRPCFNLDFHTMGHAEIAALFRARAGEFNLIEGNKSLYDGVDVEGADSNSALARLLDVPVVLVVDTRCMTRGIAPLIRGYREFETDINIAGVILNRVGGSRHEGKLRAALERYTDVPVLGAVGNQGFMAIAERHLGLIPANEAEAVDEKIAAVARIIEQSVDLDAISSLEGPSQKLASALARPASDVKIAVARDAAFGFYYPDDLEALAGGGAELVMIDTLHDANLPDVDGLFIGGGFPETQAAALTANASLRAQIRAALEGGMPAYGECGGLMYLSRSVEWQGWRHEMVGFVPGDVVMQERPVGRGYVRLRETADAPWPGSAEELAVHEFHHAALENLPDGMRYAYAVTRGHGIDGRNDGLVLGNLLASFSHQRHTAQNPWADRFLAFVRDCRKKAV